LFLAFHRTCGERAPWLTQTQPPWPRSSSRHPFPAPSQDRRRWGRKFWGRRSATSAGELAQPRRDLQPAPAARGHPAVHPLRELLPTPTGEVVLPPRRKMSQCRAVLPARAACSFHQLSNDLAKQCVPRDAAPRQAAEQLVLGGMQRAQARRRAPVRRNGETPSSSRPSWISDTGGDFKHAHASTLVLQPAGLCRNAGNRPFHGSQAPASILARESRARARAKTANTGGCTPWAQGRTEPPSQTHP
jgi:hypothetical protein